MRGQEAGVRMLLRSVVKRGIAIAMLAVLVAMCVCVAAYAETVTDVIVGRNNKGPYALTWANVNPASISVVLNGFTLKKGEKYNIDVAKGMVSFTSILLNDTIVRVTYDLTNKSVRTAGKMNVPVTLNVFQKQDASVQVTGLYAQDDPKNPDAGKTVVGVGGEKKWDATKVTSQVFLSQRNENSKPGEESNAWERSAFKVGSETKIGGVKLSGSMTNAGADFAGGSETGLGKGRRGSDLGVAWDEGGKVQASASLRQVQEKDSAGKDTHTVAHDETLTAAPLQGTKVAITHSATETTTDASNSGKVSESAKVKVDQTLGVATATVSATTATVTTGATTDRITTQEAAVGSKIASAQVSLTQKDSDTAGQTNKTDMSAQLKLIKDTEIKGRMVTTEEAGKTLFQRDASLVSKPVEFAKVEATLSQKGVDENDDVTKTAKLELSPFKHTQLTAGYKYIETGPRTMTVKDYAATTKPVKCVSFAGSLRQREVASEDAPDTTAMQMSLSPLGFFTLTGGYQSNPEDNQGQVQRYNATDVGMKVKFGSLGVTTGYSAKNEYAAQRLSDEGKIGLEVAGVGAGTLTTGVKVSRMLDGSASLANTYSLGYKQDLGSAFNLSLMGYYTQYMKDKAAMPDKTEYSAEASLGIKF